jgi:hypothetical protein
VLRTTRSPRVGVLTFVAALAIGLGSSISTAPLAGASTATEVIDTRVPAPMPLLPVFNPVVIGLHVIDAVAGGIADVVEFFSTPEPIAIPAPHNA